MTFTKNCTLIYLLPFTNLRLDDIKYIRVADVVVAVRSCKQRRTRRCYCLLIACILGILVVAVGFGILFGSAMIRPKSGTYTYHIIAL